MSQKILLDTHSLLWSGNGRFIRPEASTAVLQALDAGQLFTSAICIWEIATAARKNHPLRRPDLRGMTPRAWFDDAVTRIRAQVLPITTDIAAEAADLAPLYGSGDPGDCFLIATARIHSLTLITRDARILAFAQSGSGPLSAIAC